MGLLQLMVNVFDNVKDIFDVLHLKNLKISPDDQKQPIQPFDQPACTRHGTKSRFMSHRRHYFSSKIINGHGREPSYQKGERPIQNTNQFC